MNKIKKIIFLHNINHYYEYLSIENQLNPDLTSKIIALSLELRILLKYKNVKVNIEEDYIDETQAMKIDDLGIYMAKNWHNNYFNFLGISFGDLVPIFMNLEFSKKMRIIQFILNAIETEEPKKIVIFDENDPNVREFNNLLKYICLNRNISLEIIPSKKSFNEDAFQFKNYKKRIKNIIKNIQNSKPLKSILKKLSLIFLRLDNLKAKLLKNHYKNVMVYEYTYNYSIINEASKEHNIFLLENQINLLKYSDFLQNLKNLLTKRKRFIHIYLEAFESRKIRRKTDIYFKKYLIHWRKFIKEISSNEIFFYNDLPLWPLFKGLINRVIFIDFKQQIHNIFLIDNFLKKNKFNIIILSSDITNFSKILSIISSKMHFHSLAIQHGVTGERPIGFFPSFCSRYAVWSKETKDFLNNYGMDIKKLVVTGAARFDEYIALNKNEILKKKIKRKVYNHFKIAEDKKLIVCATTQGDLFNRYASMSINLLEIENNFFTILRAIKNMPDSHLIIKLHPWDGLGPNILLGMIQREKIENISIIQNYDIINLICACDCFITEESTAGIEAMLMEKPLLILGDRKLYFNAPYLKYYPDIRVTNSEELISKARTIFNSESSFIKYDKFLEKYIYKIDGFSTKRVMNLINELIYDS